MTNNELLNRTRICISKLSNGRVTLRGDGLADRISKKLKIPVADIISVFSILKKNKELICESWFNGLPLSTVNVDIKSIPKPESYYRWGSAMRIAGYTDGEIDSLQVCHSLFDDLDNDDQLSLAKGLKQLKSNRYDDNGHSKFIVSSKYLMGSSKILDMIPNMHLKNFGLDIDDYSRPVSYVIVAGPKNPEAVVLVENPQALEAAIKSNVTNIAWIATFGYGLSMIGDEYGRQLANIIEDKDRIIVPLVRSGSPPTIDVLLSYEDIYFWGDLDLEGLKIYTSIKSKLPSLKLSGLYNPMLRLFIDQDINHSYIKLTGKEGQKKWKSTDAILNLLIEYCQFRGLDQEVLTDSDIKQFANSEFVLPIKK